MFIFILQLIILIYIIIFIYNIIELKKYNMNSNLFYIKNNRKNDIYYRIYNLNPFIINQKNNFSFNDLLKENKNYLINDNQRIYHINNILKKSKNNKEIKIYKNQKMFYDFNLIDKISFKINDLPNYNFLFPINYSLSIFNGKNIITSLKLSNHNYNIIGNINGDNIIYLFNPKHKNDIQNKNLNQIKKWSNKIIMKKNDILFIPINWYYIQEINYFSFQYNIDIDNYFTFLFNNYS